jgi:hypothetical protein
VQLRREAWNIAAAEAGECVVAGGDQAGGVRMAAVRGIEVGDRFRRQLFAVEFVDLPR